MKKFASAATSILLTVLMAVSCMSTAFADENISEDAIGSITLTKYVSGSELKETVSGATFTAYRILDFDGKTYTVNDDFSGQVKVSDVVNTSASNPGTLSYGTTDELEAQISKLQRHISANKNDFTQIPSTATTDENGEAKFENLDLGVYLVEETGVPEGYIVSSQAFLVAVPQWDQENDKWVYDITDAKPKDEKIEVTKVISDDAQGTAENGTKGDSYSIGDTVPFDITTKIPNYGYTNEPNSSVYVTDNLLIQNNDDENKNSAISKYNAISPVFYDTLSSGLTLDVNSLTVEVFDANGTVKTLTKGDVLANLTEFTYNAETKELEKTVPTVGSKDINDKTYGDYTVNAEQIKDADGKITGTKMTVLIAWATLNDYQGKQIRLTYNAVLDQDAVVGTANTNVVDYKFSNDPQKVENGPTDPDDPTTTTTTDRDEVYTYEMDLTKKFNGENAVPNGVDATEVTFELYVSNSHYDEEGGWVTVSEKLNVIKDSDGSYTIWTGEVEDGKAVCTDENGETVEVGTVLTELNPNAQGQLVVKGFEEGTYELKETKSTQGYTLLKDPVTIKVEEVENAEGEVTASVTAHTLAYNDDEGEAKEADSLANNAESGKFLITINNPKNQFNLPTTGGLGLWMFTIAGGVVMACAIIFFSVIHKKRANNKAA